MLELQFQAHPLRNERRDLIVPPGKTISDHLKFCNLDPKYGLPEVLLIRGGYQTIIPVDFWSKTKPKPGTRICVSYQIQGRETVRTLAILAVTIAAPQVAGFLFPNATGFALSAATYAVTVVGALAVNALIPPPTSSSQDTAQNFAVTGTQNVENPYGVIPKVLGRHRMYPSKTARGFTQVKNNKDIQFIGRFTFGYGPVALEDLRIGQTPISEFSDVQIELRGVDRTLSEPNINAPVIWRDPSEKMTLYPDDVAEDSENIKLEYNQPVVRNTRSRTRSVQIDISFQGLRRINDDGKSKNQSVSFSFKYRKQGNTTWKSGGALTATAAEASLVRFTHDIDFDTEAEYQIEIRRTSADNDDSQIVDDSFATAIRSFRSGELPSDPNLAEIAIKIKASEELNGVVDSLNAIVVQMAPIWDGNAWSNPVPVRHPAWIYADLLRGPHLETPVNDERLNLTALKAWADDEPHWTCDYVVDDDTRVLDVLSIVTAAGRAKYALTDLKYSIIRDNAAGAVRQLFTPRNSQGFSGEIAFPKDIHGFRVLVRSERIEWETDEILVFADGYDVNTASLFETLELPGIVVGKNEDNQGNAWKLARYHLAQAILRPEKFEFTCDFENLKVTRGDLIQFVHEIPKIGIGAARITELSFNEETQEHTLSLDSSFPAAGPHRLTVRRTDGSIISITALGAQSEHWITTDSIAGIKIGDLLAIEKMEQESQYLLVSGITAHSNLQARITAVPAAPGVLQADQGVIPDYQPIISDLPLRFGPPLPTVLNLSSGRHAALKIRNGVLQPRIAVDLGPYNHSQLVFLRLRWAQEGEDWIVSDRLELAAVVYTNELSSGNSYKVQIRTEYKNGATRGWFDAGLVTASTQPPPNQITNLTARAGIDTISLSWNASKDDDLSHYVVYAATASTTTLVVAARPFEPNITLKPAQGWARYRVAAVDYDGQTSELSEWLDIIPHGVRTEDINIGAVVKESFDEALSDLVDTAKLHSVTPVQELPENPDAGMVVLKLPEIKLYAWSEEAEKWVSEIATVGEGDISPGAVEYDNFGADVETVFDDIHTDIKQTATDLQTTKDDFKENLTSLESGLDEVKNTADGAATTGASNASAISGLSTRVGNTEGSINAQSTSITSLESGLGEVKNTADGAKQTGASNASAISGLSTRVGNTEGSINAQSTSITSLSTTVNSNTTKVTEAAQSIDGIEGKYGVTIDAAKRITGFQLIGGGTRSDFIIHSNRFLIVGPNTNQAVFTVVSNDYYNEGVLVKKGVYLNNAALRAKSIVANHLTSNSVLASHIGANQVTADKINVSRLDAISANLGTIKVGSGNIHTASITNANIANGAIDSAKISGSLQSDNFRSGSRGWKISKTGDAEFHGVVISRDNVIKRGTWAFQYGVPPAGGSLTIVHREYHETDLTVTDWPYNQGSYYVSVTQLDGSVHPAPGWTGANAQYVQWGFSGEVIPVQRSSGTKRLWVGIYYHARNVQSATGLVVNWAIKRIT